MTTLIDISGAFLCAQNYPYWSWTYVAALHALRVFLVARLAEMAASNWLLAVNATVGGTVWSFYFTDQLTTMSHASIFAVTAGASIGMLRKLWCQWRELKGHSGDKRCWYQIVALMPPLLGAIATTIVIVVRHPLLTPYDWWWLLSIVLANIIIHLVASRRANHGDTIRQVGAAVVERGEPRAMAAWQFATMGSSMSTQAVWGGAVQTLLILAASWGRMKQKPNRHTRIVFRLEWFGNSLTYGLLIVGWLVSIIHFGSHWHS